MVNTVQANADHGRDFYLLTNHMIKSQNFTKGDIRTYFTFKQIFIRIQSAAAMRTCVLMSLIQLSLTFVNSPRESGSKSMDYYPLHFV